MIEKIDINQFAGLDTNSKCSILYTCVNELVDAVNGILDYAPLEMAMKAEPQTPAENVQPDAESRPENVQDETPRCPFCGEELSYAQEIDGGFEILTCDCPHGIWLFGNDKMWYTLGKIKEQLTKGDDNE